MFFVKSIFLWVWLIERIYIVFLSSFFGEVDFSSIGDFDGLCLCWRSGVSDVVRGLIAVFCLVVS